MPEIIQLNDDQIVSTKDLSEIAKTLITILSNINDLIVVSSDRNTAAKEIRAFSAYAESHDFPVEENKIDNFKMILLDSRATTLSSVLTDIAVDVFNKDKQKRLAV